MRILIELQSDVHVFTPSARQLAWLQRELPGCEIVHSPAGAPFLCALREADVAVFWRFEADWYGQAPRLRQLFTPSAGKERLALDPRGIVSTTFGSFHGAIMAESLLAMILSLQRKLGQALTAQRQRRWDRTPYEATRPLRGQVALMIGLGAIGLRCAQLLASVGMRVHGLRRHAGADPLPESVERVFTREQLLEAVALADHIICVLPGDSGTVGLLDARAFGAMRATACVYNLGRGSAIASDALSLALRDKRIAGAFLDVLPEEPLPSDSPLWDVPELYITPHASAMREDYLDLFFVDLVRALRSEAVGR